MVHRRPVYIYLFNVPSFSSRHFNKIKRTSCLGRLLALSLEILFEVLLYNSIVHIKYTDRLYKRNTWITALIYASKKKPNQSFWLYDKECSFVSKT